MPVGDVVRAAGRAGLSVTEGYVYVVRRGAGGRGRAMPRTASRIVANSPEQRFVTSALEIGLGRAAEVLDRLRRFAR
jgi:hypothetical protein